MLEIFDSLAVKSILGTFSLLLVLYIGYRIILAVRPSTGKDDMSELDLAKDFEEMRLEGDINEEELRSIRAVLGKTQQKR